ncbi:high-temperature-induced dauer-formation protein-domain-containing protein [Cladochytrium replicatum]|nr:high-temperature-induced dauer-formation protein-domain-containing protein [Cladochytrium replicatum]
MGATESKLAFRKNVFQLYEQRGIPAQEHEYWARFYQLPETAEDVFNLFSPKDTRKVRDAAPENLETLISKLITRLSEFLDSEEKPTPETCKQALNCVRTMTRLIPYIFELEKPELEHKLFWSEATIGADVSEVIFSSATEGESSEASAARAKVAGEVRGVRLMKTVIGLLFFRGFTIPFTSAQETVGVHYTIWSPGVGASSAPTATREHHTNRTETLRLLLTLLSRSIYVKPAAIVSKFQHRWASAVIHGGSTTGIEKRGVLTLLCSLLNTVCAYDPVGWGIVPYNHMLFTDTQEQLVALSVHTLVALLDVAESNESVGVRSTLSESKSANAYLPGSTKRVTIHAEVLMLFWKLIEANEILTILSAIIYFTLQSRNDPTQVGLSRMCCFLLHNLSQERAFGVQLNTNFDAASAAASGASSIASKQLPVFSSGTWADFLFLSAHAFITTTGGKFSQLSSLHETLLIALANVSPYVKGLSVVAANKLMTLFSAFASPGFMFAAEGHHKYIFYVLEIFNNLLQYQMTGNSPLIYSIVRNKQKFYDLHRLTFEGAQADIQRLRALKAARLQQQQSGGSVPATPLNGDGEEDREEAEAEEVSTPGMSEKARGKQRAGSGEASERAGHERNSEAAAAPVAAAVPVVPTFDDKGKFVPTKEWFYYWKAHLPLSVILTLCDTLAPQIEHLCIEKGLNDDRQVLEHLQSGTLVGLLPIPHPIYVRRFFFNEAMRIWFTSYLWGVIFLKSTGTTNPEIVKLCPPIWTGKLCFHHRLVNIFNCSHFRNSSTAVPC